MAKKPTLNEYMRAILDTVASYPVRHGPLFDTDPKYRKDGKMLSGLAVCGVDPHLLVNEKESITGRRQALIHEALHLYSWDHKMNYSERDVVYWTDRIYEKVYGKPPIPLPPYRCRFKRQKKPESRRKK